MADNLLEKSWADLDSAELRLLLDARIGGPGQYQSRSANPNQLYLPRAGARCQVKLVFQDKKIAAVEPGEAFDNVLWKGVAEEIENSLLVGPRRVGRDFSFSSFRVSGSWRGKQSGVQILPPPDSTPRADVEGASDPFILEFPMQGSEFMPVTLHRRTREHSRFTRLLNVLLAGRTSLLPRRQEQFWARVPSSGKVELVLQVFFGPLGEGVLDAPSPAAGERLEEVASGPGYYHGGNDGKGLRVPTDLDELICRYLALSRDDRAKFDRAAFWIDMAARQWHLSMSLSFTAVVSAIESLMEQERRGVARRFKEFAETYAPGESLENRRGEIYDVRSGILHGRELMQLDEDVAFGWDPPWEAERELHLELAGISGTVLRNWLRNPAAG
jgi:hypothetical protein